MNFNTDAIEYMKKLHNDHDGTELDDEEAREALQNLCEYFETLYKIDKRLKEESAEQIDSL